MDLKGEINLCVIIGQEFSSLQISINRNLELKDTDMSPKLGQRD